MVTINNHTNYFSISEEEIAKLIVTDLSKGLSEAEVDKRLLEYGHNNMDAAKKQNNMKTILTLLMVVIFATPALCLQDTLTESFVKDTLKGKKIRHYEREMIISGSPEEVFAFMDDIRNTGKHMTESSGAMAGSKLTIEWLSDHKTGLGTKYRWTGKVVGMKMDFTVEVNKWIEGKEKVWGTVGDAKMIVIDWFEMNLIMAPEKDGKSKAKLGINYTKHKGPWGFLFGKWYSKWCVKSMLRDTKKHFENKK